MKKLFFLLIAVFALSVSLFADATAYFAPTLSYHFAGGVPADITLTTDGDVFIYAVATSGSYCSVYACSSVSGSTVHLEASNSALNGDRSLNSTSVTGFYNVQVTPDYATQSSVSDEILIYPSGTSLSVIASDFGVFEQNYNNPPVQSSFRVPAGNVLYFQVDREQDVTLDANMPKLSSFLFGGTSSPWGDSGIMYGPAAALPSSSTTFPIASQDSVRWSVKSPTNVLGQSRVGTASKRCIIGQWYALYLPSIFGLTDNTSDLDSSRYLPGASVDISGSFSQIKVFPLESQYDWSDANFVTGSSDDYSSYYDGTVDENGTVTFTDQDGDVATPPNGGSNQFDVDTNPLNLVETIKNLLSDILKEIESLFTFGYSAISSLVGLMQDFVSVLGQLYTWLPDPVYSALISAIVISIVIGVFKVFL